MSEEEFEYGEIAQAVASFLDASWRVLRTWWPAWVMLWAAYLAALLFWRLP